MRGRITIYSASRVSTINSSSYLKSMCESRFCPVVMLIRHGMFPHDGLGATVGQAPGSAIGLSNNRNIGRDRWPIDHDMVFRLF